MLGRLYGLTSATGAVGALVGSVGVGLLVDVIDVKFLLNTQATLYVTAGVMSYLLIVRGRDPGAE